MARRTPKSDRPANYVTHRVSGHVAHDDPTEDVDVRCDISIRLPAGPISRKQWNELRSQIAGELLAVDLRMRGGWGVETPAGTVWVRPTGEWSLSPVLAVEWGTRGQTHEPMPAHELAGAYSSATHSDPVSQEAIRTVGRIAALIRDHQYDRDADRMIADAVYSLLHPVTPEAVTA